MNIKKFIKIFFFFLILYSFVNLFVSMIILFFLGPMFYALGAVITMLLIMVCYCEYDYKIYGEIK